MLCIIYTANITGLQAEACKEYRESGFQCSSTSVGALSLQGAHCCVPCGIRSSSVKCSSSQRSVIHTLLVQHICILQHAVNTGLKDCLFFIKFIICVLHPPTDSE